MENKQLWVGTNVDKPKHFLTTNINTLFRNCEITYAVTFYSISGIESSLKYCEMVADDKIKLPDTIWSR